MVICSDPFNSGEDQRITAINTVTQSSNAFDSSHQFNYFFVPKTQQQQMHPDSDSDESIFY